MLPPSQRAAIRTRTEGELGESSPERVEEFRRILVERGVPTFVRYSRGRDVMAACGQLALLQIDSSPLSVVSPQ